MKKSIMVSTTAFDKNKTLLKGFNTPYSMTASSVEKFSSIPESIKLDWELDYNNLAGKVYDMDIPAYKGKVVMDIGLHGGGGQAITFYSLDGKHYIPATNGHDTLGKDEVVVREFNENKGILKFMVKNKIVKNLHKTYFQFNEHLPVCRLIMPTIQYKKKGKVKIINSACLYEDMLASMKLQVINAIRDYALLHKSIVRYVFVEEVELPFTNDGVKGFVKSPKYLVSKEIKDNGGDRWCLGVSSVVGDWDYDFDAIDISMDIELLIWVLKQLENGAYRY
jgi:hypothetical protein